MNTGKKAEAEDASGHVEIAKLIEAIKKLRKEKQIDEAEVVVSEGLARFEKNPQLHAQAAENFMARRDWTSAIEVWAGLVRADEATAIPEWVTRYVRALRGAGRLEEASSLVALNFDTSRSNKNFVQEAAHLAAARQEWAAAANLWEGLVASASRSAKPQWYTAWSQAEIQRGHLDRAEDIIRRALVRFPQDRAILAESRNLILLHRIASAEVPDHAAFLTLNLQRKDNDLNVETVCRFFWEIEEKYDLLGWAVSEVHPWPLLRMELYYRAVQILGLFTPPHPAGRDQIQQFSQDDIEVAEAGIIAAEQFKPKVSSGPLGALKARLFPAPKAAKQALLLATRKIDGVEQYSAALRAELDDDVFLLDRPFNGTLTPGAWNLNAVQNVLRTRYSDPDHAVLPLECLVMCQRLRAAFAERFGIDIGDISESCQRRIASFAAIRAGAKILFGANNIETLYLTYGYGANNQAMIAGARDAGAQVVELQHGFISPLHLGYSWPGRPDVPYTPDILWCFGDFWWKTTPLSGRMKGRTIGAPYVHALAAAHRVERNGRKVVFTSQGVIGPRLFPVALTVAERRQDLEVIFRLHPNESLETYEAELVGRQVPSNFRLSHRSPNIFALLAEASIQVGVFSTTLFEGMALGCRTIVYDLPGAEYMQPAIATGDAIFARDVEALIDALDEAPLAADADFYYAKPVEKLL